MNYLTILTIACYLLCTAAGTVRVFHIVIATASLSILAIALIQAGVLRVQNNYLKSRNFSSFITKLPPKETMENLLFKILKLGFFLLTITMLTSLVSIQDYLGKIHPAKLILSMSAWLLFCYLIMQRSKHGLTSSKTAIYTLLGVLTLCLASFGSKILT